MSGSLHVYRALDCTSRLLELAQARACSEPGSVLWVAPCDRALRTRENELLQRWGVVCGIRFATLTQLMQAVYPGPSLLASEQRLLVLEEIVAELSQKGEQFPGGNLLESTRTAIRLVELFEELLANEITPEKWLSQAKEPKDRAYGLIYREYTRRIGIEVAPGKHAHANGSVPGLPSEVTSILLDGFASFTSREVRVLQTLANQGKEIHLGLLDEPGDERAELFSLPRAIAELFGAGDVAAKDPPQQQGRPAGLAHLTRQLFRPLRRVQPSNDAEGLQIIQAPGQVGEVRLLTRQIKKLLLEGVSPESIDVVVRDWRTYADLAQEIFDDHGLDLVLDRPRFLSSCPPIAFLLRALQIPDEDYPFATLTAILRHGYFKPPWPEASPVEETALSCEVLLRLLGIPRGQEAYLAAVERWAEQIQPGLEDESADESRRKKIHELAKSCRPFLQRLFRAWNGIPGRASLREHLTWLENFALELGLASFLDPVEERAWEHFWKVLRNWNQRTNTTLDRRVFLRQLSLLTTQTIWPEPEHEQPAIRMHLAEQARYHVVAYRFVLGMGERSFPRISSDTSLMEPVKRAELGLERVQDYLPSEMLLFYELLRNTQKLLVLSYPAVDDKGQELLAGSFLQAVEHCFTPGTIPIVERRMLLEGFFQDQALSPTDFRLQVAAHWPAGAEHLSPSLRLRLQQAEQVRQARFEEVSFTPYDGQFQDPYLVEWVGRLFGPHKVFSPTALEEYIACPFRFFLRHVLHLEPLEQPSEQIESNRRGMVVHRALARLHQRLRQQARHQPDDQVREEVLRELLVAVEEDAQRAPADAIKELWRLEGRRLARAAERYPSHWDKFVLPWRERGVQPRPFFFEIDFGLPSAEGAPSTQPLVLCHGQQEVRIWGRIDRVDCAELADGLGFWVIDYKTGRPSHYTATELISFRKVQLTLYALAVESVLLQGKKARPLGMAYWLFSDSGPKVVLPGRSATIWLEETERWPGLRSQLIEWIANLARHIRQGEFPLAPRSEHCTETCPYAQVCRITQARARAKVFDLPLPGAEGKG